MILTRYLYEKSYIDYSLLLALLNRDSNEALFWIYELYFSGFKKYAFSLVWKYYYMLYSPFFVCLERFLQKKTLEWLNNKDDYTIIGTLVINLATREPCIDTYLMMLNTLEYPTSIKVWIDKLSLNDNYNDVLEEFVGYYNYNNYKSLKSFCITQKTSTIEFLDKNIIKYGYISRILSGIFLMDENNRFDKKIFIVLKEKDCKIYKNKPFIKLKSWKIPENECIYRIQIPYNKQSLPLDIYQDWINNVYDTPIWKKRIEKYCGYIFNNKIIFDNEDDEENFYNMYNFEPDEQTINILHKWYGEKKFNSLNEIYQKFSLDILHTWFDDNLENILKSNINKK